MEEGREGEQKGEEGRIAFSCYRSRKQMRKANCHVSGMS